MPRSRPTHTAGHQPVMLDEVVAALAPRPGGRYLDGTFGGGGHAIAILDASAPAGHLLAIDADLDAIERGRQLQAQLGDPDRLVLRHGNFRDLPAIARDAGFLPLDGILLDLGLSSFQLDTPDRGFAFRFDGPLDMRFDQSSGLPAGELINTLPAEEIAGIIWRYGEDPRSRRIAAAIAQARQTSPIESTAELARIVERAAGGRRGRDTHPATRTFQALRIAVNDELATVEQALDAAVESLAVGGRLAVIAFHSLEDRIVKQFMQRESKSCICPPEQPICTCHHVPRLRIVVRSAKATNEEIERNPRSRSAILRVAERLAPEAVGDESN